MRIYDSLLSHANINYYFNESIYFDLLSFLLIIFLNFFFYKKKIINKNFFIILSLLSLSPLLFNNLLINPYTFPDQTKYIAEANYLRSNFFKFGIDSLDEAYNFFKSINHKVSFIYFLFFPITLTINGIAFINKIIFNSLIIYLYSKKKINEKILIFTSLTPSVLLYSSLSIQDNMIMSLLILFSYAFIFKVYTFIFLVLIILFLIKKTILILIFFYIFLYYFLNLDKKFNYLRAIVFILIILVIHYKFSFILENVNKQRFGYFSEFESAYTGELTQILYSKININSFYSLIIELLNAFYDVIDYVLNFFSISTFSSVFIKIDNIYILFVFWLLFNTVKNKLNFFEILKWILILFSLLSITKLIIFSPAGFNRYFYLISFFIFYSIFFYSIKNMKKINNNNK